MPHQQANIASTVNLNTFEIQHGGYRHLKKICNGANMICTEAFPGIIDSFSGLKQRGFL